MFVMAYLKYILRNATRNKLRSALTVMSLCVSLALMGMLFGYVAMQDAFLPTLAKGNRVIVMNIQGFGAQLPIAHLDRIRATAGVKAAMPYAWYIGMYKEQRTLFAQIGTDATQVFDVWDECALPENQMQAWQENRQGCVVDRITARRFGWEIGEHIPLKGGNYNYDLDLTLCGIYRSPDWIQGLFFHWEYLDEGLRQKESEQAGQAGFYFLKATSADVIPAVCKSIDQRFESSEFPTLSQSHQEFARMFSKFLGNIQAYIRNIGLAVAFALTLVAANGMAMSMRERTTEVAVLKALGFRPSVVLALVLGESILVAAVGGVLGVAAAQAVWAAAHQWFPQYIPIGHIAWIVVAYGIVVAIAIGLLSGLVPAVRAARLSVVDGLRRVE
jgi:putative ABC transport system permease protein